ncbi:hypothetical protein H0A70_11945 [Alcaligenaceae bacterium]|nr:hypothetical protein [Alcaligenaceae bacterium]
MEIIKRRASTPDNLFGLVGILFIQEVLRPMHKYWNNKKKTHDASVVGRGGYVAVHTVHQEYWSSEKAEA